MKFLPDKKNGSILNKTGGALKSISAETKNIKMQNPVKSVGMKLFLTFFCSIVVFVLIVGFISYYISKDIIKSKVSESSHQTIIQASGKLDLLFRSYEDLTVQLLFDKKIKESLVELETSSDQYDLLQASNDIMAALQSVAFSNKTISTIHLLPLKDDDKPISTESTLKIDMAKTRNQPWFKQVLQKDGEIVWLDTKSDIVLDKNNTTPRSNDATLGIARVFKDPSSFSNNYMLFFQIKVSALAEELATAKLGDQGHIEIVDPSNIVLGSNNAKDIGNASDAPVPKDASTKALKKSGTDTITSKSGKDLLIAYQKFAHNDWTLVGSMPVGDLVKEASHIRNITIIMALLAALLAIVIGFLMVRMIGRPLVQIRNLMNEGEKGNLSVRTNFRRTDEIGELGQSFNQMMEQITRLVQQTNLTAQEVLNTAAELSEASKKTATSAREIAVATEEIAAGAGSLAVEAEKGTELTGSIDNQMKIVIESNVQMGTSAADVEQVSEQGIVYMSELIAKTNTTEEMTRSMVEKVDKLKESTSSIRKILDVLNNVTRQTNILSLNAAIEAARAGTAGKGFMVVADEIRKLADQSRESIDVVAQITEMIQQEIDETVAVLSTAYPIFQEQISSVKEADSIFKTVQSQMVDFIHKLDSATESIQDLDQAQSILSGAMTNVSAVAQQSSATSEEVASLSTEQLSISESLVRLSDKLESVSTQLKESLAKFTV